MATMNKQLHWSQRMALVRHNLHSASRSGDFTFFKTLQAAGLMEGTNHVATLSAAMGDEADALLAAMDNLNSGLAYIHQDAFQNVYESLKNSMRGDEDEDESHEADRSKLFVDTTLQKNMADMAIDKSTSSAIALIHQQQPHVQDMAANVWITGVTIVAESIEVSLKQMDSLESKINDFIRLEDSWTTVKASIVGAITGLKGVFTLMGDPDTAQQAQSPRATSFGSAIGAGFRKLSIAVGGNGSFSGPTSRTSSTSSQGYSPTSAMHSTPIYRTPNYVRGSVSAGCPTKLPDKQWNFAQAHRLAAIPPTPAADMDEETDPFDTTFMPPLPEVEDSDKMPNPSVAAIMNGAFDHSRRMSQSVA